MSHFIMDGELSQPERDKHGRFLPGHSFATGRPTGARALFAEQFAQDFLEVWNAHGKDALLHLAKDDPVQLVKAAVGFLPKTVDIDVQDSGVLILHYEGFDDDGRLLDHDAETIRESENIENLPVESEVWDSNDGSDHPPGRLEDN